jgi:hypothetical protein
MKMYFVGRKNHLQEIPFQTQDLIIHLICSNIFNFLLYFLSYQWKVNPAKSQKYQSLFSHLPKSLLTFLHYTSTREGSLKHRYSLSVTNQICYFKREVANMKLFHCYISHSSKKQKNWLLKLHSSSTVIRIHESQLGLPVWRNKKPSQHWFKQ